MRELWYRWLLYYWKFWYTYALKELKHHREGCLDCYDPNANCVIESIWCTKVYLTELKYDHYWNLYERVRI